MNERGSLKVEPRAINHKYLVASRKDLGEKEKHSAKDYDADYFTHILL